MVSESLCWKCKHATDGRVCEWARNFKPVKGWTAVPHILGEYRAHSYYITECPKYEEGHREVTEISDEAANALLQAIVQRAVTDWKRSEQVRIGELKAADTGLSREQSLALQHDVERFFLRGWYTNVSDSGELIVKALRSGEL